MSHSFQALSTKEVGILGEKLALQYLEKQGFKVKEKNFRTKIGEIDIIVMKGARYHFVEVKTLLQKGSGAYQPEDQVHQGKLDTIVRVAESYAMKHFDENTPWQVDVVAVTLHKETGEASIKYLPNVL